MKNLKIFLFILLAFFITNITSVSATNVKSDVTVTVTNPILFLSDQAPLILAGQTVVYHNNFAILSTTGGSGSGTVTYAITVSGAGCSISGTTLSYTSVGTCGVTATKPADTSYNAISSNPVTTFTITKKPITVTATSGKTKVFGSSDPTFTYTNTALVIGDSFTGALSRTAGETVGTYAINQGTLSAGNNYTITFVPNNFTITVDVPPTPTITSVTSTSACFASSPGSLTINWSSSTGATSYTLLEVGGSANVYTGNATSYVASGPTFTLGSTHTYKVKATNSAGSSGTSSSVSGKVGGLCTTPPPPVTNFTATPSTCSNNWINLAWDISPGATSYQFYRDGVATAIEASTKLAIYSCNTTTCSGSDDNSGAGFILGSTHTYKIRATNGSGSSAQSALLSPVVANICKVTFNKNNADVGSTDANPTFKTVAVNGGNVGTLPTAPTRTGYTFSSWNTLASGAGASFIASTPVTAIINVFAKWTAIGVPAAPVVTLTAVPSSNPSPVSTTLTWSVSGNAITSCTTNNGWNTSSILSSGSQPINGITSDQTYTLYCTNTGGNSNTASASVTITAPSNPPTVDSLIITYNGATATTVPYNSTVRVSWSSIDANYCNVSSDTVVMPGSSTATNTLLSPVTSPSLKKNTTFKVTCYNAVGDSDFMSKDVLVAPIDPNYLER